MEFDKSLRTIVILSALVLLLCSLTLAVLMTIPYQC